MTHDCYSTKRTTVWSQEKDGQPGFAVKYQDGYISWCPKDTFERDYRPVQGGHLSFGQAIEAMKAGRRVRRLGWNGKGMHIYLEDDLESTIESRSPRLRDGRMYHSYIVLLTAQGTFQPGWNASTPDVLANDWEEVVD